jgi:hypothetical protein
VLLGSLPAHADVSSAGLVWSDLQSGELSEPDAARHLANALFAPERLPARYRTTDDAHFAPDCATPLWRIIERHRDSLDDDVRDRLPFSGARGGFTDSLETPRFLVSYDTEGPDRILEPDFAERLAEHLESAFAYYRDVWGMPEAHGTGRTGAAGRPLIQVGVLGLEGWSYASPEASVDGPCPSSSSGAILIDKGVSDENLPATAAHELWHVFVYGIDPWHGDWLHEGTARWAQWQAAPSFRNLGGVTTFMDTPHRFLWSSTPFPRAYGGGLYWVFLQEHLGAPIAAEVWKGICAEPDWHVVLRNVLARHGRDFDELLAEFWRWNYRTGDADDGRHYAWGRAIPRVRFQVRTRISGTIGGDFPDSLRASHAASNFLLFEGPATREDLRVTFDGAPELASLRDVTLVATTRPRTHGWEETRRPDGDGNVVFDVADWFLFDEVALIVTNYAGASAFPEAIFSWSYAAQELGEPVFDVSWKAPRTTLEAFRLVNAPNPFATATQIRYRVEQPEARTELFLLDVTGRRIRALVDATRPAGDYYVGWDGTDERGLRVSAGVYYLRLENGGVARTRTVEVLR